MFVSIYETLDLGNLQLKNMRQIYSIVKDSSTDLGVNINFVQNWPTIKTVCTKITFFLHIWQYFDTSERK